MCQKHYDVYKRDSFCCSPKCDARMLKEQLENQQSSTMKIYLSRADGEQK